MSTFSFQDLKAYLLCPRLFEYQSEYALPQFQSDEAKLGTQIHHDLHLHFERGFVPKTRLPVWDFYQTFVSEFEGLTGWSEWPFYLPLDIKPTAILLEGRIDRLYLNENTLIVMDWKTGAPKFWDIWQIEFYAWVLWQIRKSRFPQVENIETYRVYLSQETSQKTVYSHSELLPIHKRFVAILKRMNTQYHRFIPDPCQENQRPWCHHCNFNKTCTEGQRYREKLNLSL